MDKICMHDFRKSVDERYVGFKPNGASIKPVHIASGAARILYGQSASTDGIKKLSYVCNAKGKIPAGNSIDEVFEHLASTGAIDTDDISKDSLASLRNVLQKVLAADDGVFGVNDSMISYSAGSSAFITRYAIYEDAGEFIGGVVKAFFPEMSAYIKECLSNTDDHISVLFEPVLDNSSDRLYEGLKHEEIPAFIEQKQQMRCYLEGLATAGKCLLAHFKQHPNKLTQLRLFNFYCVFGIIRYLSLLEAFYCEGNARPILLDFSNESQSSIARASVMCYTQIHRAISRFYAWGFAQELARFGYNKKELLNSDTPVYEQNPNKESKAGTAELSRMWELAKDDARDCGEDEALLVFGAAIYDMIALEASSHPVNYLRSLGTLAGVLWPPTNFHVNKRFILSQDMLEMVLRCCVMPTEVISATELRNRLWQRFGIIVGGSEKDIALLYETGSILHADADSLSSNFSHFATALQSMNFAEVMADGILQIRLGGTQ